MSGGRIERTDIDQHFDRLLMLVRKLGVDSSDWELCEGDADAEPRQPWTICDTNRRLVTLGYTRRAALSGLAAQTNILAVILERRTA